MSSAARNLNRELLTLFAMEQAGSKEGLQVYLNRVLEQCCDWFRASGASIFLRESVGDRFILNAKFGPSVRTPDGATIEFGVGLAGAALAEGKPTIIKGSRRRDDIGSSIIVPLIHHGVDGDEVKAIGVLNLARSTHEPHFDQQDLEFAEGIGNQIALAVDNATLFADSKHLAETLKTVLMNLGFGLLSLNREGQITHSNPEVVMMLGRVPGQLETLQKYINSCHEEFVPFVTAAASDGLNRKRHRARFNFGNRVMTVSSTPLPSSGCTIILQDVTELESAQREYERLRRLAEVGQMTATIAHEIRNPLTGVRSAAKMIRETPELADEFAEIIEVEAVKLSKLCDEFLEFARPLKLELSEGDLARVVEYVAERLRDDFATAEVNLEVIGTSGPMVVWLDERRMEQVIRNLLINALHATAKGGTVKIGVQPGAVFVEDTGCGMDEETVARLFSPFFTTKPKGTGLGLSMVRKIIDAHEATIGVHSVLGEGTRFEIRFNQEQRK